VSLQSRLGSLITAIGADIKRLDGRIDSVSGGSSGPSYPDKWVNTKQSTTSTTFVNVTELSGTVLPAGKYALKAWIVWQSTNTSCGAGFWLNVSGTTPTRNVGHLYTQTTGGSAATGINDQQTSGTTAQMIEGRAWRGTDPGSFSGVDTANADQLSILEAILILPAQGTLNISMKSETGASISIESGSLLEFKAVG
jgi:hypothetical protein